MHRGTQSRLLAAALALIVVALLGAGCGSGGDGDGGSTAKTAGGKRGDVLTIANPGFPATLDPASGENGYSDYYDLAYDPLLVQQPDGSFTPGLAVAWRYGPRNMSFSMRLRPNVRFSDGEPLDAEAVKTWIQHVADYPGGAGGGYLRELRSIDVTGPLSLTLHFRTPTPLLELVFSQFLQIGKPGSPRAIKDGTLRTFPVGAGAYVLDRAQTVARDHYTFVPNPSYWNQDAIHWNKIVIKTIVNPSAALQALKTGQVQLIKDQPVTTLDSARSAGLRYVAPMTLMMALQFSDRDGRLLKPLGDVRVRQAINYAIDREAITNLLGSGYGEVIDQMAIRGDDAYDSELESRYPYDPAKARALLTEAGYPDGFTLPVVAINAVGQDTLAQALTGQLARVGITVKPTITTNGGDYVKGLGDTSRFPAAVLSWGRVPAVTNYQILWGPDATGTNSFRSQDPQLDAIYARLAAAAPDQADAMAREMQRFLVDNAWFAPVSATPLVVLHSADVAGVEATPERSVTYASEFRPAG